MDAELANRYLMATLALRRQQLACYNCLRGGIILDKMLPGGRGCEECGGKGFQYGPEWAEANDEMAACKGELLKLDFDERTQLLHWVERRI